MINARIVSLMAGACVAAMGGGAYAQSNSAAQLEEVVVTAERREASLQDVPISVTALSTERLEAKQVTDVLTLTKMVPGMQAKPTLSPLELSISIRGVTQLLPLVSADPAIGSYVDGVYNVVNAGSNNAMIDMERVEVLKGPQGTLFGRNTVGGAISITTAKPSQDFGGFVEAAVGNHDTQTYTGVVTGPIIPDLLAARLVYQHTEHAGYGKAITTNTETNSLNQDYVRGSILATPADGWEIFGSAFYTKAHGDAAATRLGYVDTAAGIPGLPPTSVLIPALEGRPGDSTANYVNLPGFQDTASGLPSTFGLKQYGVNGTITGKLSDAVTVKSITAFTKTNHSEVSDFDGTPYVLLDLFLYPVHAKQFSQEFQIYGDAFENRLKWIAGAYYFRGTGDQISHALALSALRPPGAPLTHEEKGPFVKNTSYSAFAQATYEIMPKVRLTGGVRYVTDRRNVRFEDHAELGGTRDGQFLRCLLANTPAATTLADCTYSNSVKYHYTPWTIGLDFKPDEDTLLYAKVSKGFRSGAWPNAGPLDTGNAAANAAALAIFAPAAPERLVSYEAGGKFEFFDKRLRVNTAAYWSKYDNIQLSVNRAVPGCATCTPIASLENSGSAEIYGGELEVTALLGGFMLDGQLGYTHPKYVKGPFVGTDLVNVSKLNYAVGGSYPIEMSAGVLTLGATYSYRSKAAFYTIAPGLAQGAIDAVQQKGFGLIDARASFELSKVPLTLAVFGQNLANKKYFVAGSSFASPLGFAVNFAGVPRLYGVSLKYKY